ncbi:MAG: Rieske (2Fe-2S) protein [Acidimicrobiia bacterium]
MADAGSDGWEAAASLDDLWEGEMQAVEVGGVKVLLVNAGGEVAAFEDRCPHREFLLSEGDFDGEELVCAGHGWSYRGRDGQGVNPDGSCLRRFAVRVDGDSVLVAVGEVVQEAKKPPV